MVGGHSYGELVALCAARRFDAHALHWLSLLRGRLMADRSGDDGGMLAVNASLLDVERILRDEDLPLTIANRNAPRQAVLSGSSRDIERATATLDRLQIRHQRLRVAAAFHSPLVASAREPFEQALASITFEKGRLPVFANSTAREYPSDADSARSLLANQLAEPVEFVEQIRNMYDAGVRTFVEVGPSGKLTGLVRAILADREFHALAVDASSGKRTGLSDLAKALAKLASIGHSVKLPAWDPVETDGQKPQRRGVVIPLVGANYRNAKPSRPRVARPRPAAATPIAPASTPERVSAKQTTPPSPASPPHSAVPAPTDSGLLRQGLLALQKAQEQAAQLHKQFLENQIEANRTIQSLLTRASGGNNVGHSSPHHFSAASPPAPTIEAARPTAEAPVVRKEPIRPAPRHLAEPGGSAPGVAEVLVAVVSEKTGYPREMLQLEMGLDADLGIDSIKRVEILSALQERLPTAPKIGAEHIGSLRTLSDIVQFLGAAGVVAQSKGKTVGERPELKSGDSSKVSQALLDIVAEKTGYPSEMLHLDMGLDADLGIDSIKRVEILSALQERLPGAPQIGPEHLGSLKTLGDIAGFLAEPSGASEVEVSLQAALIDAPVTSVVLLEVVAEKTGYPVEMLNLEMGLDADLGIDSIKRVEILAALQERLPGAPQIGPEHLGALKTLGDIARFVAPTSVVEIAGSNDASDDRPAIGEVLLGVVAEKTGYPVEMLNLEMGLDADLGIDSIKRVEILSAIQERLPHAPQIGSDQLGSLHTLGDIATFLSGSAATKPSAAPARTVSGTADASSGVDAYLPQPVPLSGAAERPAVRLPQGSVVWLVGEPDGLVDGVSKRIRQRGLDPTVLSNADAKRLAVPESLSGLILIGPPNSSEKEVALEAFRILKRTGPALRRAAEKSGAGLMTVSRMDGAFGLLAGRSTQESSTSGAGLAGLVKTAGWEWPGVSCKALDVSRTGDANELAARIADEFFAQGPLEVGLTNDASLALELRPLHLSQARTPVGVGPGDVVVVTGGARGVTAEIAVALAEAAQPTVVVVGRTSAPSQEPGWLRRPKCEAVIKRMFLLHDG
jgi:acyl carrier protein